MSETYAELFDRVKQMDVHDFERWFDSESTDNYTDGKGVGYTNGLEAAKKHLMEHAVTYFTNGDDELASIMRVKASGLDECKA